MLTDMCRKREREEEHYSSGRGSADHDVDKDPADASDEHAGELFVEGLVTRGEAVKSEEGKLPPGATHEIIEEEDESLPKVKRRRFSAS